MSHQCKRMDVGSLKLKSGFYPVFLVFWLALKISPAMAIGHAACGDLSMPDYLADVTRISQTIFTAKIIGMTDLGIIKLKNGESLIYSKMDIIIDDILKLPSMRKLEDNQKISVFIIDENYAKIKKITKKIRNAGEHALFMTDNNRYTISGDNSYDKKIYAEIEKRIKTSIWNGATIVALPCEYGVYDSIDDYIAEQLTRIRDYIHLQR
ncbi:hypothetical protein [Pleomorphomonas oryzae]|uniref:hypothetical protein n=1 Tax=Pleomorphomonas oryzae TaxID=261934 RepID=UPI0012EB54DD|nr:hypothetical protein [Pleomorphomonas oryzae]